MADKPTPPTDEERMYAILAKLNGASTSTEPKPVMDANGKPVLGPDGKPVMEPAAKDAPTQTPEGSVSNDTIGQIVQKKPFVLTRPFVTSNQKLLVKAAMAYKDFELDKQHGKFPTPEAAEAAMSVAEQKLRNRLWPVVNVKDIPEENRVEALDKLVAAAQAYAAEQATAERQKELGDIAGKFLKDNKSLIEKHAKTPGDIATQKQLEAKATAAVAHVKGLTEEERKQLVAKMISATPDQAKAAANEYATATDKVLNQASDAVKEVATGVGKELNPMSMVTTATTGLPAFARDAAGKVISKGLG